MGCSETTRVSHSGIRALLIAAVMVFACLMSSAALAQDTVWRATVSEKDVYENPDDHELNLQYAKEQIKLGEMLNAGSALERMLYANPNWHSARLLYARVLYRLDDQQAAMRELSLLENRELNTHQTETLTRYKKIFSNPHVTPALSVAGSPSIPSYVGSTPKPDRKFSGQLIIGAAADSNAGNAFADEAFGFGDRGDISAFIGGKVELFVPVKKDKSTTLTAGIDVITQRHETFTQSDFGVYDAHVGVRLKSGKGRVSADIMGRQLNISGEKYLKQVGPRVSFSQPISKTTHLSFNASVFKQDYDNLELAPREEERDGIKTNLQLGISKKLNENENFLAAFGYETKSADLGAFAYQGPVVAAEYKKKLDFGQYFKTQVRVRQLNYRSGEINPVTTLPAVPNKRKDSRMTARIAVGIPIGSTRTNDSSDAITLEIGGNYNTRNSNIDSNDYENFGADARLIIGF